MGFSRTVPAAFGIAGHPLDHHDKHHAAFIPTAQPTHPPAVDLIPQPRFSEKSQVLQVSRVIVHYGDLDIQPTTCRAIAAAGSG